MYYYNRDDATGSCEGMMQQSEMQMVVNWVVVSFKIKMRIRTNETFATTITSHAKDQLDCSGLLQGCPSVSSSDLGPVTMPHLTRHEAKTTRGKLTNGKYLSIALIKRCLYCFGPTMVGSPLPPPPRNADSFTQLSSFLSHV